MERDTQGFSWGVPELEGGATGPQDAQGPGKADPAEIPEPPPEPAERTRS